ncbi:MAG: photosynthetic complex putative assembly protein PuhB, partial [Pseudomonadota bacterium]
MSHDDFAIEPVRGLPERPPEGEDILWQGKPNAWALAKQALLFWWVMGYFVFLALWRLVAAIDIMPVGQAIGIAVPFLILAAIVGGLLFFTAWVQARATVYTVTNKRVAMRIGAALTVTLNLPYTQIESADLDLRKNGVGTIALTTRGEVQFAYLVLWPHVRPWRFPARPALRCIPDAERVARLLAEAAEARVSMPQIGPVSAPVAAE